MSASPDETEPDSDADDGLDELLRQVARGPHSGLLPPGASVGEYEIVKFLGSGAFGTVYHATHAVIGKQVALKVLSRELAGDPAIVARFVDEARAVNRIAHPNIVDIFGFGSLPDGRKYCVMELLVGETLGAFLKRRAPISLTEALPILTRIAAALDAAHTSSIVHRDLKPDNIFLCHERADSSGVAALDPKVKLLDFGIAQIADGLHQKTGSQLRLGTPAYMSPEQCEGGSVDYRSDIYALGLVAFEMLTGHAAFEGANALQVALKQVSSTAPPPSSRLPELSKRVDDAILQMLSKRAQDRPDSATAAIRALGGDRLATQLPGQPLRRFAPLALAALAIGGVGLWWALPTPAPTASPEPVRAVPSAARAETVPSGSATSAVGQPVPPASARNEAPPPRAKAKPRSGAVAPRKNPELEY